MKLLPFATPLALKESVEEECCRYCLLYAPVDGAARFLANVCEKLTARSAFYSNPYLGTSPFRQYRIGSHSTACTIISALKSVRKILRSSAQSKGIIQPNRVHTLTASIPRPPLYFTNLCGSKTSGIIYVVILYVFF